MRLAEAQRHASPLGRVPTLGRLETKRLEDTLHTWSLRPPTGSCTEVTLEPWMDTGSSS